MTLYDALVSLAQQDYRKINIDLCGKTIKVGKSTILENGILKTNTIKIGDLEYAFDALIDCQLNLDDLYMDFKYSLPSANDRASYFHALNADELSDGDMVLGMERLEARVRLEAYILLASLCGILTWQSGNKWYIKGTDPDFVLLKKYFN